MRKIRYILDNFISRGLARLIFILFFSVLLLSSFLALIVAIALRVGFIDAFWFMINYVLYPGTGFSSLQPNVLYSSILFLSSLIGLFITSFLISFISQNFEERLDRINSGLSDVIEKNHLLVLGFNKNMMAFFNEIIYANLSERNPVIVILSEQKPQTVHAVFESSIQSKHNTKIIIRRGSIDEVKDLERCAIEHAKAVTILGSNDFQSIKALLAIRRSSYYSKSTNHVSLVVHESSSNLSIHQIMPNRIVGVNTSHFISLMMSQSWVTPRISDVYDSLLSFHDHEIYIENVPGIAGRTFGEVFKSTLNATPIGVCNSHTIINPPKEYVLKEDDRIICIEEDNQQIKIPTDSIQTDYFPPKSYNGDIKRKLHLGLIGFNKQIVSILNEVIKYEIYDCTFTFFVQSETQFTKLKSLLDGLFDENQVEYLVGDVLSSSSPLKEILVELDSILVLNDTDMTQHIDVDHRNLLILMKIHELEEELKTTVGITTQVGNLNNLSAFNNVHQGDFIVSEVLEAQVLAQITESKELIDVIKELISEYGNEIYIEPSIDYFDEGLKLNLIDIKHSLLDQDIIVIGFIEGTGTPNLEWNSNQSLIINNDLRLIVIKE